MEDTETATAEMVKAEAQNGGNGHEDRSFTVKNLRQPGGWKSKPELLKVFDLCEHFELKFTKPDPHKKLKIGTASCVFSSVKDAQSAYSLLSGTQLDGEGAEIVLSDKFVVPGSDDYFKIPADESLRARTIYALNLVTSDRGPLEGILGQDAIEAVKFLPQEGDKQQAEILMSSEEEAVSAKQDANIFDDEEMPTSMKLLTPEEYDTFVRESKAKPKTPAPGKEYLKQIDKENKPVQMAPEVDEEDIIAALNRQVEEEKLNWAELNEVEELYAICDKVSARFDGLPDSILKPAMFSTLSRHLSETESHWLREHLMGLIGLWRREVESEVPHARETQVVMRAPEYQPVMVNKSRKRKAEHTKAGRAKMGVGALLQATRVAMRTENGDVDIDEDDEGNILMNGEMLSFDSWARATRTNQPDVVVAEQEKKEKVQNGRPKKPKKEFMDYNDYKKYKKEQYEKRMGHKKMKIMDQARREMEELEKQEQAALTPAAEESSPAAEAPKPPKELDEGEIDSEEERQMDKKKKKKKNSSDSSSSSSEESSDDGGPANARGRRAQMRKLQQKKMQNNPTNNPIMNNIFDFRHQIVKQLPLDQKMQLVRHLKEAIDSRSTSTITSEQFKFFSDDVTRLSR